MGLIIISPHRKVCVLITMYVCVSVCTAFLSAKTMPFPCVSTGLVAMAAFILLPVTALWHLLFDSYVFVKFLEIAKFTF